MFKPWGAYSIQAAGGKCEEGALPGETGVNHSLKKNPQKLN